MRDFIGLKFKNQLINDFYFFISFKKLSVKFFIEIFF